MSIRKLFRSKLLINAACCSDRGLVRENNEDNILFDGKFLDADSTGTGNILSAAYAFPASASDENVLFAVYDGIGGMQCGEVASYIAAQAAENFFTDPEKMEPEDNKSDFAGSLEHMYQYMNLAVWLAGEEYGSMDIGTTAVSLCFHEGSAWVSNAGDSRCYLLRDGELIRLSVDHTNETALKALGFTKVKPQLTQFVGMDPGEVVLVPSESQTEVREGDTFLLCSDGLTDMVSEDEVRDILAECSEPAEAARLLVRIAKQNGGRDNITVIIAAVIPASR